MNSESGQISGPRKHTLKERVAVPCDDLFGSPLQCSCLENPRDGGAWWAAIYGVAQSRTRLKRLSSSSRNNLGEGSGTPFQYSCLENPMDRGSWWVAVHGVAKSLTWLSDFTLTFHFHALEKEMATYSSVFAWRIPGTREPGGYRLWGLTESDTTTAT